MHIGTIVNYTFVGIIGCSYILLIYKYIQFEVLPNHRVQGQERGTNFLLPKELFLADSIKNKTQVILAYQQTRWLKDWIGSKWETNKVFRDCLVSDCILSRNKDLVDEADAVMFGWDQLSTCRKKKRNGQIWILFEYESPQWFTSNIAKLLNECHNHVVNWTFIYRRDADFTLVHGIIQQESTNFNETRLDSVIRSKQKTAVAFISHCKTKSKRERFIKQLRLHGIQVDIYGGCGKLRCKKGIEDRWKSVWNVTYNHFDDCFNVLDTQYKFYLSFENSICKDYVTEKSLHLVLRHDVVPIIRDGANHSLYHPPNSYIDTKNFDSVESLTKRIDSLSKNIDEYKQFFNWKKYYSVKTIAGVLQREFCNMCQRLHNQEKYKRLYSNLDLFFGRSHDTGDYICKKPTDIHQL